MTTAPYRQRRSPSGGNGAGRFYEAVFKAPGFPFMERFTTRTAGVFEGVAFVLVDLEGRPANTERPNLELSDLRVNVKTDVDYGDAVFAWVRGCRIADGGGRLCVVFEPQGIIHGRIEPEFQKLLAPIGVSEVVDVTQAWKTSTGVP